VADVVDRDDVRVGEGCERPHLALESSERLGVAGERRRQDFDRHLAAEARVAGAVDLAHATSAERADDLVCAESRARAKGHSAASIIILLIQFRLGAPSERPRPQRAEHLDELSKP
jgi:hypothetical protein